MLNGNYSSTEKVLVAICSPEALGQQDQGVLEPLPPLQVTEEREIFRQGLEPLQRAGVVKYRILGKDDDEPVTLERLTDTVRSEQPHVLHLLAHGLFVDNEYFIAMERYRPAIWTRHRCRGLRHRITRPDPASAQLAHRTRTCRDPGPGTRQGHLAGDPEAARYLRLRPPPIFPFPTEAVQAVANLRIGEVTLPQFVAEQRSARQAAVQRGDQDVITALHPSSGLDQGAIDLAVLA